MTMLQMFNNNITLSIYILYNLQVFCVLRTLFDQYRLHLRYTLRGFHCVDHRWALTISKGWTICTQRTLRVHLTSYNVFPCMRGGGCTTTGLNLSCHNITVNNQSMIQSASYNLYIKTRQNCFVIWCHCLFVQHETKKVKGKKRHIQNLPKWSQISSDD